MAIAPQAEEKRGKVVLLKPKSPGHFVDAETTEKIVISGDATPKTKKGRNMLKSAPLLSSSPLTKDKCLSLTKLNLKPIGKRGWET